VLSILAGAIVFDAGLVSPCCCAGDSRNAEVIRKITDQKQEP
jgi:hypothetical protein